MKKRNRFAGWFVLLLLLALVIGVQVQAGESKSCNGNGVIYNSYYRNAARARTYYSETMKSSEAAIEKDVAYYTTMEKAAAAARVQFNEKNSTIKVGVKSKNVSDEYVHDLWDLIFRHTGVPTEGDYMQWQWNNCTYNYHASDKQADGYYYIAFYYHPYYYTTKEQEDLVTRQVRNVMSQMGLQTKSDYMKIKTIYEYICRNVKYDQEHVADESYTLQFTAYAALIQKKAICQGYALLVYRMCLEAGIDCRIVKGYAGGVSHAWNIVQLKGYYYNMDATWDAENSEYYYFLKNAVNFADHIRDKDYATDAFCKKYPIGSKDYVLTGTDSKVLPVMKMPEIEAVKNTTEGQKITWKAEPTATSYNVYRKSGTGNWKIVAITKNCYTTDKTVNSGTTYQYAVEAVRDSTKTGHSATGTELLYLAAPTISSITNNGGGHKVTWKAVTGAVGYYVYQRTEYGTWERIAKTTSQSYACDSLVSGMEYIYTVRAINGKVISAYLPEAGKKMYLEYPKIAVANIKAGVKVAWKEVDGAEGYYIYKKQNGGTWNRISTVNSDVTEYTDSSVKNGTIYAYCIMPYAGKDHNKSAYGYMIRLGTHTMGKCVSTQKGAATLKWNRNSKADGYYICYRLGNTLKYVKVAGNQNLSKTITGLASGKTYQVYVRGYKKYGDKYFYSAWSSPTTVKVK